MIGVLGGQVNKSVSEHAIKIGQTAGRTRR